MPTTRREFLKSLAAVALGVSGFVLAAPRPRSDWKTHTITAIVENPPLHELYDAIGCLNQHDFCGKPPLTVMFVGARGCQVGVNKWKIFLCFEYRESQEPVAGYRLYRDADFRGLERL